MCGTIEMFYQRSELTRVRRLRVATTGARRSADITMAEPFTWLDSDDMQLHNSDGMQLHV